MTTDPTIEQLRAAALAATPGPWHVHPDTAVDEWSPNAINDATFIAAANPAVILALLARLEKAEAEQDAAVRGGMKFVMALNTCIGERDALRARLKAAEDRCDEHVSRVVEIADRLLARVAKLEAHYRDTANQ